MRKPFLVGNWKMNLARRSALELALALREHLSRERGGDAAVDVGVAPPFVYVDEVARALMGSPVKVGGQNCCDEPKGAFTGEVSAAMLVDVGASFVILGHSERRHLYGEGDELVQRKLHHALASGLDVILCVGETLAEREAKRTELVVREQLSRGLEGVDARQLERVTLAYEPVWAIGTGKVATPQQAGDVHSYLRGLVSGMHSEASAERLRIQYGGSVNPGNLSELLAVPDVDGALVGGASLEAKSFLPLIDLARRASETASR